MLNGKRVAGLLFFKENSERVPGKNFRDFCGCPLYHHIVKKMDQVPEIDDVVINTDSERVAKEGPKLSSKVIIHHRPEDLLGDFVVANQLIEYDLEHLNHDIFLQAHATNPLLRRETLLNALKAFEKRMDRYDSLFSVTPWQTRFYRSDGTAVNHEPSNLIRTQDLEPLYEENSCIYVFTKKSFEKAGGRIGATPILFSIERSEATDIDEEQDFALALFMAQHNFPQERTEGD